MNNCKRLANQVKTKLNLLSSNYVFLTDLSKEFRWDYSNLRKFINKCEILTYRVGNPSASNQLRLAITKKDAKRLMHLKFGV